VKDDGQKVTGERRRVKDDRRRTTGERCRAKDDRRKTTGERRWLKDDSQKLAAERLYGNGTLGCKLLRRNKSGRAQDVCAGMFDLLDRDYVIGLGPFLNRSIYPRIRDAAVGGFHDQADVSRLSTVLPSGSRLASKSS
jgi:hypothetical protein